MDGWIDDKFRDWGHWLGHGFVEDDFISLAKVFIEKFAIAYYSDVRDNPYNEREDGEY